jgi:thiol:disulfide interchange protein
VGSTHWRRERQFGVSVGIVLLAAATWFLWRRRVPLVVGIPGGVGALLVVLGAAWPRALVYPNRGWTTFAEGLSWVSTRVILGLLFYLVLTPLGRWRRWRGADPLARRAPSDRRSFWRPYSARQADAKHYEKMF